jgi:hypothetical protein
MVGILVDLFSIYKCPTTNIKAANAVVNRALANWWTWIILPHRTKRFYVGRTLFRSIEFRPIRTKSDAMKPQELRFYRLLAATRPTEVARATRVAHYLRLQPCI